MYSFLTSSLIFFLDDSPLFFSWRYRYHFQNFTVIISSLLSPLQVLPNSSSHDLRGISWEFQLAKRESDGNLPSAVKAHLDFQVWWPVAVLKSKAAHYNLYLDKKSYLYGRLRDVSQERRREIDDDVEGWETRELSIYSNNSSQYSIPGPVSHF